MFLPSWGKFYEKTMSEEILQLILEASWRELTEEERGRLSAWTEEHPGREEELRELLRLASAGRAMRMWRNIDELKAWMRVNRRTGRRPGWRRRSLRTRWWAAAAVLLPLMAGLAWWSWEREPKGEVVSARIIRAGEAKAVLELADGEIVVLHRDEVRNIVSGEGAMVAKDSASTLTMTGKKREESLPMTIRVPQGGEYRVVLPDSTRVWINSDSELRFPSVFGEDNREVELKGEAYFEVKRDTARPFVVRTGVTAVRVLGTSFNVCNYAEDDREQMTLAEGAVEVRHRSRAYHLKPGEQFEARRDGSAPTVKKVNVSTYTSWREGMFRFVDMPLDELVVKLQRWYNVEFFFVNANCRSYRFTGAIRRDADFGEFMTLIEKTTDVRFSVDGTTVMISEK